MPERVGLYGGSFDPIHVGHLIVARSVAEAIDLSKVIFLPSANPPHKCAEELLDASHRAEMVRRAIEGESLFSLSDHDLDQSGPSYTIDTVTHFASSLGADTALHWIIGADSLAELASWYRVADLVDACRIVTASRPGWEAPDLRGLRSQLSEVQIERLQQGIVNTPWIDISATDIRKRIRAGRSIRHLVPDTVLSYIESNKLYGIGSEGMHR